MKETRTIDGASPTWLGLYRRCPRRASYMEKSQLQPLNRGRVKEDDNKKVSQALHVCIQTGSLDAGIREYRKLVGGRYQAFWDYVEIIRLAFSRYEKNNHVPQFGKLSQNDSITVETEVDLGDCGRADVVVTDTRLNKAAIYDIKFCTKPPKDSTQLLMYKKALERQRGVKVVNISFIWIQSLIIDDSIISQMRTSPEAHRAWTENALFRYRNETQEAMVIPAMDMPHPLYDWGVEQGELSSDEKTEDTRLCASCPYRGLCDGEENPLTLEPIDPVMRENKKNTFSAVLYGTPKEVDEFNAWVMGQSMRIPHLARLVELAKEEFGDGSSRPEENTEPTLPPMKYYYSIEDCANDTGDKEGLTLVIDARQEKKSGDAMERLVRKIIYESKAAYVFFLAGLQHESRRLINMELFLKYGAIEYTRPVIVSTRPYVMSFRYTCSMADATIMLLPGGMMAFGGAENTTLGKCDDYKWAIENNAPRQSKTGYYDEILELVQQRKNERYQRVSEM